VVSDLGINVILPVWAISGLGAEARETLYEFDGGGKLELTGDITLEANIQAPGQIGALTTLYYDVAVPGSFTSGSLWLPAAVASLVPAANIQARSAGETSAINAVRDYLIPSADSEIQTGAQVEFLFQVGTLLCVGAQNSSDPRTAAPWRFRLSDVTRQRGGVSILKNVINPRNGDSTELQYTLTESGLVSVQVMTLSGEVVSVLYRGRQSAGTHVLRWYGKNGGNRVVSRGVYFIRITGPGVDEFRKVLIVR
jgi:hypothetical protein